MAKETLEQQADRLFRYIREYMMEWARPPAFREMRTAAGVSGVRLQKLLKLLQKQGRAIYITRRWRSVRLVKGGERRGTARPPSRLGKAEPQGTTAGLQKHGAHHLRALP